MVRTGDSNHYAQAPEEKHISGELVRIEEVALRDVAGGWSVGRRLRDEARGVGNRPNSVMDRALIHRSHSCLPVAGSSLDEARGVRAAAREGGADLHLPWVVASRTRALLHGDYFVVAGPGDGVEKVKGKMKEWCCIEVRVMRREADDDRDVIVLGRMFRRRRDGMELEADEKHNRLIREGLGILPGSNGVVSPAVRAQVGKHGSDEKSSREGSCKYRAAAARANYLGLDRPDHQFVVKAVCRGMAAPSEADLRKVKRIARHMQAVPKVVITKGVETEGERVINAFVDSGWAGCRQSRKRARAAVFSRSAEWRSRHGVQPRAPSPSGVARPSATL